jgi:hypothetical protein
VASSKGASGGRVGTTGRFTIRPYGSSAPLPHYVSVGWLGTGSITSPFLGRFLPKLGGSLGCRLLFVWPGGRCGRCPAGVTPAQGPPTSWAARTVRRAGRGQSRARRRRSPRPSPLPCRANRPAPGIARARARPRCLRRSFPGVQFRNGHDRSSVGRVGSGSHPRRCIVHKQRPAPDVAARHRPAAVGLGPRPRRLPRCCQ